MTFFRSANPLLAEKPFLNSLASHQMEVMTLRGTLDKFLLLYLLSASSASIALCLFFTGSPLLPSILLCAAALLTGIVAFYPGTAPVLAPAGAIARGFAFGGLAAAGNHLFDRLAPGLPLQMLLLGSGTSLAAWFFFRFRTLHPIHAFILTCCTGLAIGYSLMYALGLTGLFVPLPHTGNWLNLTTPLWAVLLPAFSLSLDRTMIRNSSALRAPRYMEWYGAFGLSFSTLWPLFFWKHVGTLFRRTGTGYKDPFRPRTS